MTPYEFVKMVYYEQTKTLLDYHPYDDKYKEVLMQANIAIEELQRAEDWSWLRDKWYMGHSRSHAEFKIPEHAYKLCMTFDDAVRCLTPHGVIEIPFVSQGTMNARQPEYYTRYGDILRCDRDLFASVVKRHIVFNRPFHHCEHGMLETDIIERFRPLHICDDSCYPDGTDVPCPKIEHEVWPMIPDITWLILRCAALRAEADPVNENLVTTLTDRAAKALSAMREMDAEKTYPDRLKWREFGHLAVF